MTDQEPTQERQAKAIAKATPDSTLVEDLAFIGHRIGNIPKTGKMAAAAGGYGFVQHHIVISKASPLLHSAGIIVVPDVQSVEMREVTTGNGGKRDIALVRLGVTFMRQKPGQAVEQVTAVLAGEGADSGDKSVSKAITQAMKKAYMVVLGLPVDEGLDAATKFDRR